MFKVESKDISDLRKALKGLPNKIHDRVLVQANRRAAKIVLDQAIQRAPVREGQKLKKVSTGNTSGSKGYRYPGYLKQNIKIVYVKGLKRLGKILHVVRPVKHAFYGLFLEEYGSSRQSARPWLRPAFDANKMRSFSEYKIHAKRGIDRAWKRLGRG